MIKLNDDYSGQYYIDEKIAEKIMMHVESADLLMRDCRRYLCIQKSTALYIIQLTQLQLFH